MAGDVAKLQQSTEWAANNLARARDLIPQVPEFEHKGDLLKYITNGLGDAIAVDRLVITLFSNLLTFQESQFGTRDLKHPQKKELQLWKKWKLSCPLTTLLLLGELSNALITNFHSGQSKS
ncbi:MAG TPA: hypothetical protein VIH86_16795 [Puia sp.]